MQSSSLSLQAGTQQNAVRVPGMKRAPIVAVFGLSGVGKSWLIGRYAARFPVLHVQASQLLREAKAALSGERVTSEELRRGAVLDNQAILIQAFARVREKAEKPIIFDGHCVVDNGEQLLEIPSEVISDLGASHIIFIEGSSKITKDRRQNDASRVRPARSETELAYQQQRAKAVCEAYGEKLGLPFTIVAAGDELAFAAAIRTIFVSGC